MSVVHEQTKHGVELDEIQIGQRITMLAEKDKEGEKKGTAHTQKLDRFQKAFRARHLEGHDTHSTTYDTGNIHCYQQLPSV